MSNDLIKRKLNGGPMIAADAQTVSHLNSRMERAAIKAVQEQMYPAGPDRQARA